MNYLKKPFVVRVTGIETADREKAEEVVRLAIEHQYRSGRSQTPAFRISVVPSCDNTDTCDALLDFDAGQPFPIFLAKLQNQRLGYVLIPCDEEECGDITFVCHFHRFTQLYPVSADRAITADVIAITGLDGHAYGSWTAKEEPWYMWLRDFLAKDLPHCRTMIYGYDSKLSENGFANIKQYSDELLQHARLVRQCRETQQRPVIFIAHSFGGILLARSLVKAQQRESDPVLTGLYRATHGIAFFGVPHYGMVIDDIQNVLGPDHPRQQLLNQISTGEYSLNLELDHFINIIEGRQKWQRIGKSVTQLSYEDAILRLPEWIEEKYTIQEDHSNMVKLVAKSSPYNITLRLRECEAEALSVVRRRFDPGVISSVSTMPFGRDTTFVGRKSILNTLQSILKDHSRAGIHGLGGIGKSQLAIECAYRLRDRNPDYHLFWVHASSQERFLREFQDIARACKIPGHSDSKADILNLVSQWLRLEHHGAWLLVLDNVDDDQVLLSLRSAETHQQDRLIDYVPDVRHGKVLVTSRPKSAAGQIVGYRNICHVEAMDEEECLQLVRSRLGNDHVPIQEIQQPVNALDHIPLAITQACAFLNQNEVITIPGYITQIAQNDGKVLQKPWTDLRRDKSVPNAVIDAFMLSFTHIDKHFPLAAFILSVISLFDRQGIPMFLIEALLKLDNGVNPATTTLFELDIALSQLSDYSLIKAELQQQHLQLDIHSLVQTAVKAWQTSNNSLGQAKRAALGTLAAVTPNGNFENWETWRVLSPHVSAVLSYHEGETSNVLTDVLFRSAWCVGELGDYELSEKRAKWCLIVTSRLYKPDSYETLRIISLLASTYMNQGRWQEAEELGVQVVETRKRVLGAEHPSILASINNLAWIWKAQGRDVKAIRLMSECTMITVKVLDVHHPDTKKRNQTLESWQNTSSDKSSLPATRTETENAPAHELEQVRDTTLDHADECELPSTILGGGVVIQGTNESNMGTQTGISLVKSLRQRVKPLLRKLRR